MVPCTRRRLLHVAAAGLGGLAGCSQLTGESAPSSRSADGSDERSDVAADTETDPPTVMLRGGSEVPPIRPPDFERTQSNPPEYDYRSFRSDHRVIGSQSTADGITADDGEAVSEFVSRTDFENETLYLESTLVQECYRLRLCEVSWGPDTIGTEYARHLRPYDEQCATETRVFESRLIRLPVALDADAVHSFSSSVGRGQCNRSGAPHVDSVERSNASTTTGGDGR